LFCCRSKLICKCVKARIKYLTQWHPELLQAGDGAPIIFVGNKIDMRDEAYGKETFITKEAGQKVADKLGIKYL